MNIWNPGGKRPHTLREWGVFVDGLSRQISILAHEGVHLSGTELETGPGGAETVEGAVLGGLGKPPVAPL